MCDRLKCAGMALAALRDCGPFRAECQGQGTCECLILADTALRAACCPYPFMGDDGTERQCIERGHCGCTVQDEQTSVCKEKLDG